MWHYKNTYFSITEVFLKTFVSGANVGVSFDANDLRAQNDAVVACTGATWPRDLKIPGREADGIHFAMEFLQVNLIALRQPLPR